MAASPSLGSSSSWAFLSSLVSVCTCLLGPPSRLPSPSPLPTPHNLPYPHRLSLQPHLSHPTLTPASPHKTTPHFKPRPSSPAQSLQATPPRPTLLPAPPHAPPPRPPEFGGEPRDAGARGKLSLYPPTPQARDVGANSTNSRGECYLRAFLVPPAVERRLGRGGKRTHPAVKHEPRIKRLACAKFQVKLLDPSDGQALSLLGPVPSQWGRWAPTSSADGNSGIVKRSWAGAALLK